MKDLGQRVLILVIATISLGTLIMWMGAFFVGDLSTRTWQALLGIITVVFIGAMVVVWEMFDVAE